MKPVILLLAFLSFTCSLYAQDCPEYNNLITEGDNCLKEREYDYALYSYMAALRHCDAKMDSVMVKLTKLFQTIKDLKIKADDNRFKAVKAQQLADLRAIELQKLNLTIEKNQKEMLAAADLRVAFADSIADLNLKLSEMNNSIQKERIRQMGDYVNSIDSLINNTAIGISGLNELLNTLKKNNQLNTRPIILDTLNLSLGITNKNPYENIQIPPITYNNFAITDDLLTGQGTDYSLSPNVSKTRNTITTIVIHITNGSKSSTINWFNSTEAKISSHLIIGLDGSVTQITPFNYSAWHAGRVYAPDSLAAKTLQTYNDKFINPNYYTIGIELEGKLGQIFPEKQLAVCMQICKLLKQQYPIKYILGHNEIYKLKTCPGDSFPMDKFRKELF